MEGHPLKTGNALPVVKTEIRLWYFCGQTKNHRQFGGDFSEIGGPEEDRTPEPFGCEAAPETFFEHFRPFLAVLVPHHFIFEPL